MKEMEQQIITHEKSLLSSTLRGDKESVSQLLAEDFLEIGMSGSLFTKSDILKQLKSWDHLEYEGSDFKLRQLDQNTIQILYKALVKDSNGKNEYLTRRSSIWQERNKKWVMIFHQGTKIQD